MGKTFAIRLNKGDRLSIFTENREEFRIENIDDELRAWDNKVDYYDDYEWVDPAELESQEWDDNVDFWEKDVDEYKVYNDHYIPGILEEYDEESYPFKDPEFFGMEPFFKKVV